MDDTEKLRALVNLRREWQSVERVRMAALVRACVLVEAGTLSISAVCTALGVSESTWRRWVRLYDLRDLARECVGELDQALRQAGATEGTTVADVQADADLALAAGKAGVWAR